MASHPRLFVDLDGLELLARRLEPVAVVLVDGDQLIQGAWLGRPRVEEGLAGVLDERLRRHRRIEETLGRLGAGLRSAGEAYVGAEQAAVSALERAG